jgi:hypothetical protein
MAKDWLRAGKCTQPRRILVRSPAATRITTRCSDGKVRSVVYRSGGHEWPTNASQEIVDFFGLDRPQR